MTLDVAPAQVPAPGALTLDHVAHFVPDVAAASAALERLGYTLTPYSPQSHRLTPDGPLVPAGTGNRCVMLEGGYLEFLTATGDSPVATQLRAAMARYTGLHLVAFGTSGPAQDHARLEQQGYRPLPAVALQRPIETEQGTDTARFTVVRVPPGTMAEGRIQYCQQHTPQLLWQARWVVHRNTATALAAVILCVADVKEAATRYARYTGLTPKTDARGWHIDTARGAVWCVSPEMLHARWGVKAPALPWIAGTVITARDMSVLATYVQNAGCPAWALGTGLRVELPRALGGICLFQPPGGGIEELSRA
jgi:hypothetical protein